MTDLQLLVAHGVKVVLLALLVGILWRGRAALCWSFTVYVLAILLGNILVSFWPSRFLLPSFWMLKQRVYDVLKILVALELAWRAFGAFPGARRTARAVIAVLLSLSTFTLAFLTPPWHYSTVWDWQPAVSTAALWLLTATALMVVWYQVPVHEWQRAIMLGLAPYLLVFVSLLGLLKRRGWTDRVPITTTEMVAYLLLILFWTWAAWRREAGPTAAVPARGARPV